MFVWQWFLIWCFGLAIPIPPTQKGFKHKSSKWFRVFYFVLGVLIAWLFICTQTNDTAQAWWFIWLKVVFVAAEFLISQFLLEEEWHEERRRRFASWDNKLFKASGWLSLIAVFLIIAIMFLWILPMGSVYNGSYFDTLIVKMPKGALPFNQSIPDDMVRLVTEELAQSITRQHISEFGSGKAILSTDITMYNKKLVWISVIGSENTWADPKIYGLVIIDATDPTVKPIIEHVSFAKAEGLQYVPPFKLDQIQGSAWYSGDTANHYGRAYITQDDIGNWRYVVTAFRYQPNFVREYTGVYVYSNEGNLIAHYKPGEIPYWISQPYDEQDFLEGGISDWGSKRRGENFDYWADGFWIFIAPSPDRVARSEDTRYIYDPESNDIIALVMVHPVGQERTLAGMFKATRKGIYYYDLREFNLISGITAEDHIESQLPARATGQLYATMPLLYNVEGRLVWYVPIYWAEQGEKEAARGTIRFEGLGLIDASNKNIWHVELLKEGMSPKDVVKNARIEFLKKAQGIPIITEKTINGTLMEKNQDIVEIDGLTTTEWLLTIKADDGSVANVWAYSISLDKETRMKLMLLKEGDRVSIVVNEDNNLVRFIQP